ncbi:MAG: O-antigen ligase family protein [Lentimicrobiaceae bacterium]|nr:O-antigen ligase family protein [Lentimicrobiaceae bacterium]
MTNESAWSLFVKYTCYFGLALMLAALPLSRFFMSIAQFILAGVFIVDGIKTQDISSCYKKNRGSARILMLIPITLKETFLNLTAKFGRFFQNKPALVFSSLLMIDVIGLVYTHDLHYGFKVLRNNLPLFLLPLFLSSIGKIPVKLFRLFLFIFVAAVFAGSLNSTYLLINQDITDPRQISSFIHHIRFSLMTCMGIFILAYYGFRKDEFPLRIRLAIIPLLLWLLIFLFLLRSLSGILAFFITLGVILLWLSLQSSVKQLKVLFITLLIAIPAVMVIYVHQTVKNYLNVAPLHVEQLDPYTSRGSAYIHDTTLGIENGNYVGIYLCWSELEQGWNARSSIPFNSLDMKGQEIRYTLIRYLGSKNLRKDYDGVARLTDADVHYIEHGVANIHDLKKFSLKNRIHHIIMAYQAYRRSGIHSGSSAMERIEQAKAAINIIRDQGIMGVGTGDVHARFREELNRMNSPLQTAKEGMFSAHNQFLTYLVAYGWPGLLWFLFAILYPALKNRSFHNYFFIIFFTISVVSFLGDDTLNTQAGVTFFAFFYSLFVLNKPITTHETI